MLHHQRAAFLFKNLNNKQTTSSSSAALDNRNISVVGRVDPLPADKMETIPQLVDSPSSQNKRLVYTAEPSKMDASNRTQLCLLVDGGRWLQLPFHSQRTSHDRPSFRH